MQMQFPPSHCCWIHTLLSQALPPHRHPAVQVTPGDTLGTPAWQPGLLSHWLLREPQNFSHNWPWHCSTLDFAITALSPFSLSDCSIPANKCWFAILSLNSFSKSCLSFPPSLQFLAVPGEGPYCEKKHIIAPCCLYDTCPSSFTPLTTGLNNRLQFSYNSFCHVFIWINFLWSFSPFKLNSPQSCWNKFSGSVEFSAALNLLYLR